MRWKSGSKSKSGCNASVCFPVPAGALLAGTFSFGQLTTAADPTISGPAVFLFAVLIVFRRFATL